MFDFKEYNNTLKEFNFDLRLTTINISPATELNIGWFSKKFKLEFIYKKDGEELTYNTYTDIKDYEEIAYYIIHDNTRLYKFLAHYFFVYIKEKYA